MTITGSVDTEERREGLRTVLRETGAVDLHESALLWRVHPMTIRRDLDFLEREGTARRVRGGAVFVGAEDFDQRQGRDLAAKRRIAQKLLPLVPQRKAIGMDASTTIYQLASQIPPAENLSVVTNGLATFSVLQGRSGIRTYLTGGESEERNNSLVGPLAVKAVGEFLLARSFLSTTCLDPSVGMSEPTVAEVEVKKAMAQASHHVVLAVAATKLGTRSVVKALAVTSIDTLVTELEPADPRLDPYRDSMEIL